MSQDAAREQIALARRFVQQLRELPPDVLAPVVPPLLDRDPYLSAWTNVEAALGNASPAERRWLEAAARQLEEELAELGLAPAMHEAARRAVRGVLARPWLAVPESFTLLYEPFETAVPVTDLLGGSPPPQQRAGTIAYDPSPALTPEQWESRDYRQRAAELDTWANAQRDRPEDDATEYVAKLGLREDASVVAMNRAHDRVVVPPPARSALAAFALAEQPFGFSQSDVDLLRRAADLSPDEAIADALRELARRLAALLPAAPA